MLYFEIELSFFAKGALFQGKGGPPVLEELAQHRPLQEAVFLDQLYAPSHPPSAPPTGGASGGQLTDFWHQVSSCGQYIICPCYFIVCHMSSVNGLVGAV